MRKLIDRITYFFISKEKGATAVEYALIVGLIALAIIVALTALGGGISTAFQTITTKISGAVK
jgi:pilus assembly protein Flp/PilA